MEADLTATGGSAEVHAPFRSTRANRIPMAFCRHDKDQFQIT